MGRFADAIPHLQAAIRLNGRSASAHNDLGTALMEQGQLADALAEFQRAIAITPTDENMYFNLGNALTRASRFSEAAGAYQRAITLNPEFPDAHVNLGTLLSSRGRPQDALPHFQRAADLKPNSAVIQNNLASALAQLGRYPEAMQHVRRALALAPGLPAGTGQLQATAATGDQVIGAPGSGVLAAIELGSSEPRRNPELRNLHRCIQKSLQRLDRHGLDEEVIEAGLEALPPRFVVAPARQGDQSCPSEIGQLAERAGDVEAAEARQAEVEQDRDRGGTLRRSGARLRRRRRRGRQRRAPAASA